MQSHKFLLQKLLTMVRTIVFHLHGPYILAHSHLYFMRILVMSEHLKNEHGIIDTYQQQIDLLSKVYLIQRC